MPIEISYSKARNFLRDKSQKLNSDLLTYRVSKFLTLCQGYNKLQPRILPKGLSSLITPNNDDDDDNYYFHNRPQIKQCYKRQEAVEEIVTEVDNEKVMERKKSKKVKRVTICEASTEIEQTVEHSKGVTTQKFYKATQKVMSLHRESKEKKLKSSDKQGSNVKVKSSFSQTVKTIMKRRKANDTKVEKPAKQPVYTKRGLFRSGSVDVDEEIDEDQFKNDNDRLEIVEGKANPVANQAVVVLKEDPTDPEERMLQQLFPNMKPALTNMQPSGGQFRKKSVAFTDRASGAALPSFLLTYQGGLLFTEDEIYAIPSDFTVLSSSDC